MRSRTASARSTTGSLLEPFAGEAPLFVEVQLEIPIARSRLCDEIDLGIRVARKKQRPVSATSCARTTDASFRDRRSIPTAPSFMRSARHSWSSSNEIDGADRTAKSTSRTLARCRSAADPNRNTSWTRGSAARHAAARSAVSRARAAGMRTNADIVATIAQRSRSCAGRALRRRYSRVREAGRESTCDGATSKREGRFVRFASRGRRVGQTAKTVAVRRELDTWAAERKQADFHPSP